MPVRLNVPGIPLRKRLFDLCIAVPGLILVSPFLALIGIVLLIFEGVPVFFHQPRPGLGGRIFTLHKFRTMRIQTDALGRPLPDGERLSSLGSFLRASSLDELPSLWNVIEGNLSLVGPRPLLVAYLERYSPQQMRRHEVAPGITGWAQIHGRNSLSWQEKFDLDVWYVDHWSLGLDVRILFITFWKAIKREGINQPGQATMEEFSGNDPAS
jgi:sugar transferase EpsL